MSAVAPSETPGTTEAVASEQERGFRQAVLAGGGFGLGCSWVGSWLHGGFAERLGELQVEAGVSSFVLQLLNGEEVPLDCDFFRVDLVADWGGQVED